MPEVRLSNDAVADLIEIDEYGAERFGNDAANAYQRAINLVFTQLETFPLIGEARPDYGAGIRCISHKSHRILYRVENESVEIARILHHSREVTRHLKP